MDTSLSPIPADSVSQALGTAQAAPPPPPPPEAAPPPPPPAEGTGTIVDTTA